MPTQRKPTPRKAAFKAAELPSIRVETDRRIPLIVLAVIAALMAIVLIFTQCSGSGRKDNTPAVGEPVSSSIASSDAVVEEIEEPSNPAAKASLDEYTWTELAEISQKISLAKTADDAIYVAKQYRLVDANGRLDGSSTKTVDFADGTSAAVRIIGFNHDSASSGTGKAGLTFMFADGVATRAYNDDWSTGGGWPASSTSSYLGVEFFANLPEDLSSVIVEVTKSSVTDGEGTVTETGDVMWLPSYIEVAGSVDAEFQSAADMLKAEGSQYQFFKDAGISTSENNSALVMHDSGQAAPWWLRTVDFSQESAAYYVNAAGHPTSNGGADQQYLLVPCFCI